jgi:hypothetical protein
MDFDDSTATGEAIQVTEIPAPSKLPWILLGIVTVTLSTASVLLLVRSMRDAEDATKQYVEAQKSATRAEKAENTANGQLIRISELEEQVRKLGEEKAQLTKDLAAAKAPPVAAPAPKTQPKPAVVKKPPAKTKKRRK